MSVMRIQKLSSKVIAGLENEKIPFWNYILTFFALIFVRAFLGFFSQTVNQFNFPTDVAWFGVMQFPMAYLGIIMLMAVVVNLAASIPMEKILRVMFPSVLILMIGPIVDLVVTRGQGVDISYMQHATDTNLWHAYFTYGGGLQGLSLGIKVEVSLILLGFFSYFSIKKCGSIKSVILVWVMYTLIFLWAVSPVFIKCVLNVFGYSYDYSEFLMVRSYLVFDFLLFLLVGYLMNKPIFMALLKDIRPLRIVYCELTLLFGMAVAISLQYTSIFSYFRMYPFVVINELLAMISAFFACVFVLMVNNIYDVELDKINSPNRPLVARTIDSSTYSMLTYVFMVLALFYASMATAHVFLIIGTVMGCYYLYSATPVRFKRVPLFSKLVVGLASFALVFLGYILVQSGASGFPHAVMWIYLAGVTLTANFIDLKDVKGDKAAGIVTLPVLVGIKKSKFLIGLAFFFLSVSYYFVLLNGWMLPLFAVTGVAFFYLVNKKKYEEWKILFLCNISLLVMIAFLVWH